MSTTAVHHPRRTVALAALALLVGATGCGSDADAKAALSSMSAACTRALTPIDPSDGNAATLAHAALAAKRAAAAAEKDSTWAPTSSDFAALDQAAKKSVAAARAARVDRSDSAITTFTEASDAESAVRRKVASRCTQVREKGGRVDPALIDLGLHPQPDTLY